MRRIEQAYECNINCVRVYENNPVGTMIEIREGERTTNYILSYEEFMSLYLQMIDIASSASQKGCVEA